MKKHLLFLFSFVLPLSSCVNTATFYKINFYNYDGSILSSQSVKSNTKPVSPSAPTKPSTYDYTYRFKSWSPEISIASCNQDYYPVFDELKNFTVTWLNYDGNVISYSRVAEGDIPIYEGKTPTREKDSHFIYNFDGWTTPLAPIHSNVSYTAKYTQTEIKYTVSWCNYDGSILKNDYLGFGSVPSYDGPPPIKPRDDQYTYIFSGWSPSITPITNNVKYTANFTNLTNKYVITWKNYDGSILAQDSVDYGLTPTYSGSTPIKPKDIQYTYTFSNWFPNVTSVTGDTTYIAQYTSTINKYTITWKNYDGTILKQDNLEYGAMPVYSGETPTRKGDAQFTYNFKSWYPAIKPATEDTTYYAQFDSSLNKYLITWQNYDGSTLDSDYYDYGSIPSYTGTTPTKPSTEEESFIFVGWSPEVSSVIENKTYIAQFKSSTGKYTITWKNYDGSTLKQDSLSYGDTPSYTGETPIKPSTSEHSYVFSGWTPQIETVTSDATYIATFTESTNQYNITFKDDDGTIFETKKYSYGNYPVFSGGTPPKKKDAQYTYTFDSWEPRVQQVTCDVTYVATYTKTVNSYKVTWQNYDGTLLAEDTLNYGDVPSYTGDTPTKPSDVQYTYNFSGWSPEISKVTGDITYTAQYSNQLNEYIVIWKNYDGSILKYDSVKYGQKPSYTGETPMKPRDQEYAYDFSGWSPEITEVVGNVSYTAQFSAQKLYDVTFKNYDGTVLETNKYIKGEIPVYTGDVPLRPKDVQYTYTFSGWSPSISEVTGDTVYIAQFSNELNKYAITWKNYDGSILKEDLVEYGSKPEYDGDTPVKPKDEEYTYTFVGWSPSIVSVTGDTTYIAQFKETKNKYTVTWKNYDGSILNTDTVEYGVVPSYSGSTPTKPKDEQYTYTFTDWYPILSPVTADVTYTAQFKETLNKYTITWLMDDGSLIDTEEYYYGVTPTHVAPTKEETYECYYEFTGWSPSISKVTADATYKAVFKEIPFEQFTVNFKGSNCMINSKTEFTDVIDKGGSVDYTIRPIAGYSYPITLKVYINDELAETSLYSFDPSTGEFSMNNITGFVRLEASC